MMTPSYFLSKFDLLALGAANATLRMNAAATDVQWGLIYDGIASGALTIAKTGATARTATFPDAAITVAGLEVAQTFTAAQTISKTIAGTFNAFSLSNPDSGTTSVTQFRIGNDATASCGYFFCTSSTYAGGYGGAGSMNFGSNGNVGILAGNILRASILSSGEMVIGGALAIAGNGLLQVGAASSTGRSNGVAIATDCFINRLGANSLQIEASAGLTLTGGLTIADAKDIALNTTTGTKIGTATTQKLGFWNATPIVQPASASQAAVAATGSTNAVPYGFTTSAQADAIVTLVNAIRTALVNSGIMKGAA